MNIKKLFCLSITLSLFFRCSLPEYENLYYYTNKDITKFLKILNLDDQWTKKPNSISRNSEGTQLRILLNDSTGIIVYSTGDWEKIKIPECDHAWFNDNNEIVLWKKYDRSQRTVILNYWNGYSEKGMLRPDEGPGPSGKFFVKYKFAPSRMYIFKTDNPENPFSRLAIRADCCFPVYFYHDKLYIFATDSTKDKQFIRTLQMYHIDGNEILFEDSIDIKRTSDIVYDWLPKELCPWKNEVLMVEHHTFPWGRSTYFVYDINREKLIKYCIEPFSSGRFMYLRSNILKNAIMCSRNN